MEEKGKEIARCLGYQYVFHDDSNNGPDDVMNNLVGDIVSSIVNSIDSEAAAVVDSIINSEDNNDDACDVNLWHLRTLAIDNGGLLNSCGRKLGWTKLVGVDDLVFDREYSNLKKEKNDTGDAPTKNDDHQTYEQIRKQLELEMEPSKWHIQRERRYLRKGKKWRSPRHYNEQSTTLSSTMSHGSTNDLSSIGSQSGSSTPLTANLNPSRAGTPRSVTFQDGLGLNSSLGAPSFTAFATAKSTTSSVTNSLHSLAVPSLTVNTTLETNDTLNSNAEDSPSTNNDDSPTASAPSPLSISSSPMAAAIVSDHPHPPQAASSSLNNQVQLQNWSSFAPDPSYLQYSAKYQRNYKQTMLLSNKPRVKKDRRPQERKLLIQIATSTFYLLQQRPYQEHQGLKMVFQYSIETPMQDLIAVLLLHLDSPSLTSLVLLKLVESHLWLYCSSVRKEESNESFSSCIDNIDDIVQEVQDQIQSENEGIESLDVLSLSFFPLLQLLDEDLHNSLILQMDDGSDSSLTNQAVRLGKVLRKWISCWFCCHDTLPLDVVSRIVDFFMASHWAMPIYLSMAILCHPTQRGKFVESDAPQDTQFVAVLDNLFSNLIKDLSTEKSSDDDIGSKGNHTVRSDEDIVTEFMEEAISKAISFMKQVQPQELFSLVNEYQNGVLIPYLNPRGRDRATSPSPWTTRPLAPNDYKLVQRLVKDARFASEDEPTSLTSITEKHQIALDASGLPPNQLMLKSNDTYALWDVLKCRRMTPTKAAIIGVALYVGAQLLKLNQDPFDYNVINLLTGTDTAAAPLGVAVSVGLQTLLDPLNHVKPQDLDDKSPASVMLLENNDTSSSFEMPFSSLFESKIGETVLESVSSAYTILDNTLDSADNNLGDLTSAMNEVRVDNTAAWESIPSSSITWPHEIETPEQYSLDNKRDSVHFPREQDESSGISSSSGSFVPPETEEYQPLLKHTSAKKEGKEPAASIHHIVKRYTARSSRKLLSARLKKRTLHGLKGLKKEYIALVDDDVLLI